MAKTKLTNLATVLRLLPTLTDGEKATLRDVLRPEPAKRATKKASKPRAAEASLPLIGPGPEADASDHAKPELCGACGNTEDFVDHFKPSPHYHAFEPPKKAKSNKASV